MDVSSPNLVNFVSGLPAVSCGDMRQSVTDALVLTKFTSVTRCVEFGCQGATLQVNEESGAVFIARVLHGGAADRSGENQPLQLLLGPFHGAIAVPSVTRCRCRRGHGCAGGARQYR